MTIVGNRLWIFDKSDAQHTFRYGFIRAASNLALIGYFRFNFSHANSVDYSSKSDTLMVGNGGDTGSTAPRIDLIPNFAQYGPNVFFDWNDPASTPRISIPLIVYAADRTTIVRSALSDQTRRTANAVWIDGTDDVLVFARSASGLGAVRLTLGRGANDYSTTGYGTFIANTDAGSYNGTARVVATYTSTINGTIQGADWHEGKLYIGFTALEVNARALEVIEVSLVDNGTMAMTGRYFYQPPDAAGKGTRFETEGVVFRGDELLAGGIRVSDEYQTIYRFTDRNTAVDLLP